MPSSFTFGHAINHHKYGNGPLDVVTTSDRPRDSVRNFLAYLPRWTLYALNVSTFRQFMFEKKHDIAFRIALGSAYFAVWATIIFNLHAGFCLAYVIFPVGENILLLACVNWCWHGFVDEQTPDDPFVQSVTLLGGPINVLNEDFHVVHHQYPGVHWTAHGNLYAKHEAEYKTHAATMFQGTHVFELFFLIILGKYEMMADMFVDASGKFPSKADKVKLIQSRLRACWWGPHARVEYKQKGWEGVNDPDGY
jgi:fatty acid desaturase